MLEDDRNAALPIDRVIGYELELRGVHGMAVGRYDALLRLIASGAVEPARLIGRTIGLEEAGAELAAMGDFAQRGVTVIELVMRVLAVLVLVIGFLLVWGGLTQTDTAEFDECPPFEETQGVTYEPQWWPPGHAPLRRDRGRRGRRHPDRLPGTRLRSPSSSSASPSPSSACARCGSSPRSALVLAAVAVSRFVCRLVERSAGPADGAGALASLVVAPSRPRWPPSATRAPGRRGTAGCWRTRPAATCGRVAAVGDDRRAGRRPPRVGRPHARRRRTPVAGSRRVDASIAAGTAVSQVGGSTIAVSRAGIAPVIDAVGAAGVVPEHDAAAAVAAAALLAGQAGHLAAPSARKFAPAEPGRRCSRRRGEERRQPGTRDCVVRRAGCWPPVGSRSC